MNCTTVHVERQESSREPSINLFVERIDEFDAHIRGIASVPAYQGQFSINRCCCDPRITLRLWIGDRETGANQRHVSRQWERLVLIGRLNLVTEPASQNRALLCVTTLHLPDAPFLWDDAAYILSTFPVVARHDEVAHGRFFTRDLILAQMDALSARDPDAEVRMR
jgi:hypothetical protein